MPHGEDGKGQLGLGVAWVVAVVVVALLQKGVVRGLIRRRASQAFAGAMPLLGLCFSPLPPKTTGTEQKVSFGFGPLTSFSGRVTPYLGPYKGHSFCPRDYFEQLVRI